MNIDQKITIRALIREIYWGKCVPAYKKYAIIDAETFSLIDQNKIIKHSEGLYYYFRESLDGISQYAVPHRIFLKNKGNSYTIFGI